MTALDPVFVDGASFVNATTGERLTYAGISEFRLLDRFLRGEDVEPIFADRHAVLDETRAAPFLRVLRVFGMMANICDLAPQKYQTFYTSARALTDFAAAHGFYVQFSMFPDSQIVMPDRKQRSDHAFRLYDVFRGCRTVLFELNNEDPKNGTVRDQIPTPPAEFCWTPGSNLGDDDPPIGGHYACYHGRRDGLKGLLSSCDLAWAFTGYPGENGRGFLGTHRATIHDEPIGADEVSVDGRRSAKPDVFYRLAFDAAAWGAGATFHSTAGIQSVPFGAVTRACALAFFMGLSKADPAQRFQGVIA